MINISDFAKRHVIMKVKMCGESRCHYDPAEVEEVLTCDECPYQVEVDVEEEFI